MSGAIGGTIQEVPGGFSELSGGIRRIVRTGWSWQKPLTINAEECPFCTKNEGEVLAVGETKEGWRILESNLSLFKFHRLIIPKTCWDADRLWELGGEEAILEALTVASFMTHGSDRELWLTIHIGWLAGQNQSHLHWHLYNWDDGQNSSLPPELEHERLRPDRLVFEESGFTVSAGGLKAGQCFITPSADSSFGTEGFRHGLARTIYRLVTLGNRKLRSAEGLPANFNLGFVFTKENRLLLGTYCPVINHWGPADVLGLILKRKVVLVTPHEAMAEYLRGE